MVHMTIQSTPQRSALDSPRLTASQRANLAAAGRRYAAATDKAKRAFDRAVAGPKTRYDKAVAEAESQYDAVVASIMADQPA
jgi:hypothetical protein